MNYKKRAEELLSAVRIANNLLFGEGAPVGSANYFKIREALAAELRKGIGEKSGYLADVAKAADMVKQFGPSAGIISRSGEERTAAYVLADFVSDCLEGGAR